MKIFISWSGPKSGAVAKALRDWLPMVVNAFDPFLSSDDIDKGSRWNSDIAQELEKSKAGIICLTAGNVHSDWLLFESGALSKKVEQSYVCPLLIDLKPSDVTWPLAQFQATSLEKKEILALLKTLNGASKDAQLPESQLEKAFDKWWPDLEESLKKLPSDTVKPKPERPEREILEEILETVREQNRPSPYLGEVPTFSGIPATGTLQDLSGWIKVDTNVPMSLSAIAALVQQAAISKAQHQPIAGSVNVKVMSDRGRAVSFKVTIGEHVSEVIIPKSSTPKDVINLTKAQLKDD